ncbi:secreted RxLR effector protein 161-like [Phoenix dactylifera]|uniref:Secreted RxLR effector protein 161-like n=1 Tax=Phoenix dactylifera TaxID=42345 RepID=A0A8B9ACP5_PHODC|nr:secreted RxLR effector protein 161-like [Phoenix dactylifera]
MENASPVSTLMEVGLKLTKDDDKRMIDATLCRSLVGSLMYLTATRPDLMFAVSLISRFMESPRRIHWEVAKRILRYVRGTIDYGIHYARVSNSSLVGYSDSDWSGSIDDSKITSGFVFHIGSGAISWASKKQPIVALSTAEAEYISLALAGCQALWLRWILQELKHSQNERTKLFCDNSSAIALTKNPVFHGKSKQPSIFESSIILFEIWSKMERLRSSIAKRKIKWRIFSPRH